MHPYKLVKAAAELFLMSEKHYLPTMEEMLKRDRQWDIEVTTFAGMIEDAKPEASLKDK